MHETHPGTKERSANDPTQDTSTHQMFDQTPGTRLDEHDQQLVDQFLNSGVNRSERRPFRPGLMMMGLGISILVLGVAARIIGLVFV